MIFTTAWFWIAYALVGAMVIRPLAGHFAWSFKRADYFSRGADRPNGEQWFGATCLASLIGVAWPVAVLWLLASARLPAVGAEREALVAQQRQRIRELERELLGRETA